MNININDSINNFINNDFEKVLCISGSWGVGKTYAVQKSMKNSEKIQYRYASVFGINSINDLIIALSHISDEVNKFTNDSAKSGKSQAIVGIVTDLIKSRFGVSEISLEPFLADTIIKVDEGFEKLVVIIDDIERMNKKLDLNSLLGFISKNKEHENVKFILIANENKIKKSAIWIEYKEKIIDRTLKIDRPATDVYFTILGLENNDINYKIIEKFGIFNITNLRTLLTFNNIIKINNFSLINAKRSDQLLSKLIMYALENINNNKYNKENLKKIKLSRVTNSFEYGFFSEGYSNSSESNKKSTEECMKHINDELQNKSAIDCLFDAINIIDIDVFTEVSEVEGRRILNEVYTNVSSGHFEQINNIKIDWLEHKKIIYVDSNTLAFFSENPQSTAKKSLDDLENNLSDNCISKTSMLDVYTDLIYHNFEKYYSGCDEQMRRIENKLIIQAAQEMVEERTYYNEIYYKVIMCESNTTKIKLNNIFDRFRDEFVKEFNRYYIDLNSNDMYVTNDFFEEVNKIVNTLSFEKDNVISDKLCKKLFRGYCGAISSKMNMNIWSMVCENIRSLNECNKLVDQLIQDELPNSCEPLKERLEIISLRFFNKCTS